MQVNEIMTREVVTVSPETSFKEVVEVLLRSRVSGVPVVGDAGDLVGLVTEADLLSKEAYPDGRRTTLAVLADVLRGEPHHWAKKAAASTAADVMTVNPMTCAPDDDVHVAARRLLDAGIKQLPVLEQGRLVGIVARQDILATFDRPDAAIAADIEQLLLESSNSMWEDHSVRFEVAEGNVTLSGDVRYQGDTRLVAALVHEIPGVVHVNNALRWRETRPASPVRESAEAAHNDSMKRWRIDAR